jgi:hypothetical protein
VHDTLERSESELQSALRTSMPELRKHRRYRIAVPVTFSWRDAGGAQFDGNGITRDISTAGVYVCTNTAPCVGVIVQTEILLDRQAVAPKMRMEVVGHVVRVESQAVQAGFAMAAHDAVVFDPPAEARDCSVT